MEQIPFNVPSYMGLMMSHPVEKKIFCQDLFHRPEKGFILKSYKMKKGCLKLNVETPFRFESVTITIDGEVRMTSLDMSKSFTYAVHNLALARLKKLNYYLADLK